MQLLPVVPLEGIRHCLVVIVHFLVLTLCRLEVSLQQLLLTYLYSQVKQTLHGQYCRSPAAISKTHVQLGFSPLLSNPVSGAHRGSQLVSQSQHPVRGMAAAWHWRRVTKRVTAE